MKTNLKKDKELKSYVTTYSKLFRGGSEKVIKLLEEYDVIIITVSGGLPLKLTKATVS